MYTRHHVGSLVNISGSHISETSLYLEWFGLLTQCGWFQLLFIRLQARDMAKWPWGWTEEDLWSWCLPPPPPLSLYSEMLLCIKMTHSEHNMKMGFFTEMRIIYSYTDHALILKLYCFSFLVLGTQGLKHPRLVIYPWATTQSHFFFF